MRLAGAAPVLPGTLRLRRRNDGAWGPLPTGLARSRSSLPPLNPAGGRAPGSPPAAATPLGLPTPADAVPVPVPAPLSPGAASLPGPEGARGAAAAPVRCRGPPGPARRPPAELTSVRAARVAWILRLLTARTVARTTDEAMAQRPRPGQRRPHAVTPPRTGRSAPPPPPPPAPAPAQLRAGGAPQAAGLLAEISGKDGQDALPFSCPGGGRGKTAAQLSRGKGRFFRHALMID